MKDINNARTSNDQPVAVRVDTPALGDTIASIPTIRRLSKAYDNKKLTVFSSKPFLFEGHPLVAETKSLEESTDGYKVYNTFYHLAGKSYQMDAEKVEFRYSNMDIRQFHAVSLGFTLTEAEMETDLYIERERNLPFKDYVIIHPTHTWPTRTWAQEKWQELVDMLNDAGIPVVAVGRDSKEAGNYNTDKPVMDINIKLGVNLLNDESNDPAELRWMMNHQAMAVVTMDSGMLHIAGTTDVNIIQLSSSIDYRLRAPYRKGSQDYKYNYVDGGCEMCSSDMSSNIKVHGSIHGVPPQVRCLNGKDFDECHPTPKQVYDVIIKTKKENMGNNVDPQLLDMRTYISIVNSLDIKPKTILEIGSRDGHHAEALRRSFNINNNDVYVVDANPKKHEKIRSSYPDFNFIGNAISDKKGTVDFYQIDSGNDDWDGISGMLDRPDLYNQDFTNTKKIEVESITGRELIGIIKKDVDICKIDVEGLTYEVLKSFGEDIYKIKTLHIETEEKEVWAGQKLDSDVKVFLESMGFVKLDTKTQKTKWGEQYDQIWVQGKLTNKKTYDKIFVTHCDESYIPIVEKMIESVKTFSDIPFIAYVINSDTQVKGADETIRLDFDIRDGIQFLEGNNFIDRKSHRVYDIITKKVNVLEHALEHKAKHVVYLDGDSVATNNVNRLFSYINEQYPMFTQGINQFMLIDGVGNPFVDSKVDLSKTLEMPLCDLLGLKQEKHHRFPNGYIQTGYISAVESNLNFIKEWKELCEHKEIKGNPNKYAPYHEETIANVLLWKYNYKERMPLVYVNAQNVERVNETYATEFNPDQKITHKAEWFAIPSKVEEIAAFHGAKDTKEIDNMIKAIKKQEQKKRLVYLTPHLSTGGMPQFVLTRILALQEQEEYDVHLVEYTQYSNTYIVQRDQIVDLLGENFHSVGYLGSKETEQRCNDLQNILIDLKPDIIHIDECPEAFDSFNKLSADFVEWLYRPDQDWRIVETCHNIWFKGHAKQFEPDAYFFCTPYHPDNNFKDNQAYKTVIEYPIIDRRPTVDQRLEARNLLEMSPDKIHVLNVGLWTPGKNQAEAVSIARRLEEHSPGRYQFHFVGNQASNFQEYWQPIMQDLPANVKVWGERPDTDLFYQAADAFIFNSTWECNPLALREAIGYGLITFSRNLPQYLDMFKSYIIPLTDSLQDNIDTVATYLQRAKKTDYIPPSNELNRFSQQHITEYKKLANKPKRKSVDKELKLRLEFEYNLKLYVHQLPSGNWRADFITDGQLYYRARDLEQGRWYAPNPKWWTDWQVKIYRDNEHYQTLTLPLEDQEVLVKFESNSLGDTLAWMGQMLAFKQERAIKKLWVYTHKNWLFDLDWYRSKGIELTEDADMEAEIKIMVGVFYSNQDPWQKERHPNDWRHQPLGKIAADQLDIEYVESRPVLAPEFQKAKQVDVPQVVIATQSTAQAKYWNNPTGWQELTQWHLDQGIRVLHASKEGGGPEGSEQLPEDLVRTAVEINSAKYFIGISSGLSWLAWALGARVVLISGFTPDWIEFQENCLRIIRKDKCWGCWSFNTFDRGDWNWCPSHKGTAREFECTKRIEASQVVQAIKEANWL